MEPFVRHQTLTGLALGIPVAIAAAWFAIAFLGPSAGFAVDLGDLRGAAFAAAALAAAALLAAAVAREDLGTFSGLFAFWGIAVAMSTALCFVGELARGAFAEDGAFLAFVLSAVASLGTTLPLWVPAAVLWVAAQRRLTIPGLRGSTEEELAASEAARDAAAREHVRFDATNVGKQGSGLRRGRT